MVSTTCIIVKKALEMRWMSLSDSPFIFSNEVCKDGENSIDDHLRSTSRICLVLQWRVAEQWAGGAEP